MKKLALVLLITFAFSCKKRKAGFDEWPIIDGVEGHVDCAEAHDGVVTCVSTEQVYTCVVVKGFNGDGCRDTTRDRLQCAPTTAQGVAPPHQSQP